MDLWAPIPLGHSVIMPTSVVEFQSQGLHTSFGVAGSITERRKVQRSGTGKYPDAGGDSLWDPDESVGRYRYLSLTLASKRRSIQLENSNQQFGDTSNSSMA